jgi:ABC-type Fe3+ transport system permease subunit
MITMLAQDGYEFAEGLRVLSGMLKPYPWWYWTLVFAGNIPTYIGLIYAVFWSRAKFTFYCEFLYKRNQEDGMGSGYTVGTIFASLRVGLWAVLCIAAVIAQHHLLWKGFFGYR